jgi:group I intron endonuclease
MFLLYRVTNVLNGKYYIGVHKTDNPTDSYLGSGVAIKRAIKQHGRQAFIKTILEAFETECEAYLREKEVITQNVVNDPLSYNCTLGGTGNTGSKRSPETKAKMSASGKGHTSSDAVRNAVRNYRTGLKESDETKRRKSESHKRRITELHIDMGELTRGKTTGLQDRVSCPVCSASVALNWRSRHKCKA